MHPLSNVSRRRFLQQSSVAMAGVALGPSLDISRENTTVRLPTRSTRAVGTFIGPVCDPETLRTLATTAIEAAVHAGAEWADLRLGDQRTLATLGSQADVTLRCGYSLRVRVQGAETIVTGADLTQNTLVAAARSAVATANALRSATGDNAMRPLAPVPVVRGEWHAPMVIDPFAVSINEHVAVGESDDGQYDGPLSRIARTGWGRLRSSWRWERETRVFASSEGSLVTQHLCSVDAQMLAYSWDWRAQRGEWFELAVPSVVACSGGFEVVVHPDRYARAVTRLEELLRYKALPRTRFEIGRQNVVLDGGLHAQLIGEVALPALSLNRALGNEIDIAGTSILAPPETMLGQRFFSPILTLAIDHSPSRFGAAAWDDEGVATTAEPLIANGVVTNYLSSRATLPALTAGRASGQESGAGRMLGIVSAELGATPVEMPRAVTMTSASTPCSLSQLAATLGTGLLACGGVVGTDPNGYGAYLYPEMLFEVRHGTLTRRVFGARFMVSAKRFLPTLSAIGDATTQQTVLRTIIASGVPWTATEHAVTAPAGLYHDVDIVPRFMEQA